MVTIQYAVLSFNLQRIVTDAWSVSQRALYSVVLDYVSVSKEKYIKPVELVGRSNILYGCRDLGYR
jgi:hypothetical protein